MVQPGELQRTDGWTDRQTDGPRQTDGRTLPSTLSPGFVVDNDMNSSYTRNSEIYKKFEAL